GYEQLLLCYPGLLGADVRGFWQLPGTRRLVRGGPDPVAFLLAGGGEPACQRRRITKCAELAGQLPPYGMADVAGIGAVQLVPVADRPDQRDVALDERVPCLVVAACGACHQVSEGRAIAHPGCLSGHDLVLLPPVQGR